VAAFLAVVGSYTRLSAGGNSAFLFYTFAVAAILNGVEETLIVCSSANPYDES